MRQHFAFDCLGETLVGTLDAAAGTTGLLIVSGGNEIRSGAHAGMARLAAAIAQSGYPVWRFDRRGTGDSTGANGGFLSSGADIAAAVTAMRAQLPQMQRLVAFGNCDAASALVLYGPAAGVDALILANPWTLESDPETEAAPAMTAAAIRHRYLAKLKDPRELWRLTSGGVHLGKLVQGLRQAATSPAPSNLATQLGTAMGGLTLPTRLLLAEQDRTAQWFLGSWGSPAFADARKNPAIAVARLASSSHSFASSHDAAWLIDQVLGALTTSN